MAQTSGRVGPKHSRYGRKRVVTSCVECYRRKQKCNRVLPCNFCSVRGVPELCRYGVTSHQPTRSKTDAALPSEELKDSSPVAESPITFADQIGYSRVSRNDELRGVEVTASDHDSAIRAVKVIVQSAEYSALISRLPPDVVVCRLIDVYFSIENWSFPILDKHRFQYTFEKWRVLRQESDLDNKDMWSLELLTFSAVVFALLAVTLQSTAPESGEAHALSLKGVSQCIQLSQKYIETGQQIVELIKQPPTTLSIEFHLLNMVWLKNSGRGSEAWRCLGTALRQAQEIDLHQIDEYNIEQPETDIALSLTRLWDIEHRKRLWARIFIMDSHMAVGLGRPRGINREDCSTTTPLDCEYPKDPSRTIPVGTKHGQQPPNSFSSIMFSISLSHMYHDLMSLRASKLDLRDYSRITNLHNDVQTLMAKMPLALQPEFPDTTWDYEKRHLPLVRQRLLNTVNIFLLALHRPYVVTHSFSRKAAIDAALTILQTQETLFTMLPQAQHRLYGYSFYTIDAGIFLTATILKYPSFDTASNVRAQQDIKKGYVRLSSMKDRSSIADSGQLVLQRCCQIIQTTILPDSNSTEDDYFSNQTIDHQLATFLQDSGFQMLDPATRELVPLLDLSINSIDVALSNINTPPSSDVLESRSDVPFMDFILSEDTRNTPSGWR